MRGKGGSSYVCKQPFWSLLVLKGKTEPSSERNYSEKDN